MALDPRRMRPGELVQLLNSTPAGAVVSARRLAAHRGRAGLRIGDGRTVDLLRYVAWLAAERHRPAAASSERMAGGYEAHKDRAARQSREQSREGRDIAASEWVHPPRNPARWAAAERSLQRFCEDYLRENFPRAWSPDHLKVIGKLERAVLEGGLFALAMPRGSGKTTLCEAACLWAILYGHRNFVALVGADEDAAREMLESIKVEIEVNSLLEDDFSEAVGPVQALEGIHQRASGQLYAGRQTNIEWTRTRIVLPTLPPLPWLDHQAPKSNAAIVKVRGILGRIRGMKHKRTDGRSARPSLVLVDDPQTDESALSLPQCNARERVVRGAILGLAGPGEKIAGLMTLTVVRPDDLADRILDRAKHPEWQAERTKMVYSFPTNEKLWAKYAEVWRNAMAAGSMQTATAFYLKHRAALDKGAAVAWPERYNPDEASAIQHAMNLRLERGEAAFWAEYQNEPLPDSDVDADLPTADAICGKLSGYRRGEVPLVATHTVMFIDVQQKALYWLLTAWEDDFSGYVVDYGTEPDQQREYFTLRELRKTLAMAAPRAGLEGAVYAGLERLTKRTLGVEWPRDGGATARVDRCLIDANWGQTTDVVYAFCRQSEFASVLMPSHGRYVGASSIPFSEYKRKRGDRVGHNWRVPTVTGRRAVRHVLFDANYWKSFVHLRLAVPMGDPGCLSLYGRESERHRLLAEHLTSEYRVKTEGRGRTVDEWKVRAAGLDNHWLDCLVGCAVAASMSGAALPGLVVDGGPRRKIRLSDLQRARR